MIIVFLILSAFFSGSEIAFVSANKLKIAIQGEEDNPRSRIISSFYSRPKDFLSTMLVGNNIALVVFTYLMTKAMEPLLVGVMDEGVLLWVNTVIITIVVLIFGEFLPKTFFRLYANTFLKALAYPLLFFKRLLSIPSGVMTAISTFIIRYVFRTKDDEVDKPFTQMDLEHLLQSNVTTDIEKEIDTDLFTNALQLKTVKVKTCMVPRTEMVTIDVREPVEELISLFDETKLSRIIVIDDDVENVLGYVHHQQLLNLPNSISPLILDIQFVPETMDANTMLNFFIQKSMNIACVVNEFGGIAGIITMEDILEEIFGDIEDEYDEEDMVEKEVGHDDWIFSGRKEIDYLNDKFDYINIPTADSYNTISGYLIDFLGDIPKTRQSVTIGDYRFTIEEVSDTRIELVRIRANR